MGELQAGKIYQSKRYGEYKITENLGRGRYKIEFIQTGYSKIVTSATLYERAVRDPYYPIYYGKACVGLASISDNNKIFRVWRAMISRCYNEKNEIYKTYGNMGITVCDRWLCFEYFLEDLVSIRGFDWTLFKDNKIVLDKDINYNGMGAKQYNLQNCSFVSAVDNFQEMISRRKKTTSSRYIGVTALKNGKWQASISYKSKNIYIGRFNTEQEAHMAYQKKHKELYGAETRCEARMIGE